MNELLRTAVAAILMASMGTVTNADVLFFYAKEDWTAAVGQVTTIDFTGIGEFVFVTDQYAELGALFTDGDDHVLGYSPHLYENDGYGCRSSPSPIVIEFATPQYWVGVDLPGALRLRLFLAGEQVYWSDILGSPFAGLISTEPFDEVRVESITNPPTVSIDDLYFGPRLPGDANGDATVDADDLIAVILGWGPCPQAGPCAADVTENGAVNVADLVEVILGWS